MEIEKLQIQIGKKLQQLQDIGFIIRTTDTDVTAAHIEVTGIIPFSELEE